MKTSKKVLLFVITLVMLNNVEHMAVVHHELSRKLFPELLGDWVNKLHSFIVVIIFEIVLITFVRERKRWICLSLHSPHLAVSVSLEVGNTPLQHGNSVEQVDTAIVFKHAQHGSILVGSTS